MAGFIRRYLVDPGLAVIRAIEGVVIIDREAPAAILGVGSGTTTVVAEFEDGPFNEPVELSSGSDFQNTFGGFGFEYDGTVSNNPCARARYADGQLAPEYWNGNGFLATINKRFSRLIAVRADTSVGSVELRRQAYVTGGNAFSFALTSGQTLAFDIGAGSLTATFTGVKASRVGAASTLPTTFTGGESFNVTIDEGTPDQIGPLDVVFQAGDQTQAQAISRINGFLGYTAAVTNSATIFRIDGRVLGTSGNVKINSISGSIITTALGITAGTTAGTGTVANIQQVSFAEVAAAVASAATNTVKITRDSNGNLRATNQSTVAGSEIEVAASTATAFGFTVGDSNSNSLGTAGTIPAGFRIRTAGGLEWVTMQTVEVTADDAGPYSVKVRPADDDGTTAGAASGAVTVVPYQPALGSFGVVNPLPLSAALSEGAIDAAYVTAIGVTLSSTFVSRQTNIIFSARQSNAVRSTLRTNAVDASANGLLGRMAVIRPPLNTSRAIAKSITQQPGVGTYRNQRVIYAYPGVYTYVPQIAQRGLSGGAGFTVDGMIDVGFDSWLSSTMSQLAPEENPGQLTSYMDLALGLERGNLDVADLRIEDYISFKANGIAAPRMDDGTCILQSGVTSVDPALTPNLVNINRRRMADFVQDSIALRMKRTSKRLNKRSLRAAQLGEIDSFLSELKSSTNEDNQRIEDYSIDGKSGNTPATLAAGVFRVIVCVQTIASQDQFVLDTTIGETVIIVEQAA